MDVILFQERGWDGDRELVFLAGIHGSYCEGGSGFEMFDRGSGFSH